MKLSTKIWLVLAVVSNVAMFYLFRPMVGILGYSNSAVSFNFTIEGYIGLGAFVLANISGTIVLVRFLRTQHLNIQIFFAVVPPTITFMLLFIFFFTITTGTQTEFTSAVRAVLRIESESARYIWLGIVAAVYVIYISIICYLISIPLKRVERAVELLRNGKTRRIIKIGGGKQFRNIEEDLKAINDNYKESDKIFRKIDPMIIQAAMEETRQKPAPEKTTKPKKSPKMKAKKQATT